MNSTDRPDDCGTCEGCDGPLERDEATSGLCDECYQARDEMGPE